MGLLYILAVCTGVEVSLEMLGSVLGADGTRFSGCSARPVSCCWIMGLTVHVDYRAGGVREALFLFGGNGGMGLGVICDDLPLLNGSLIEL